MRRKLRKAGRALRPRCKSDVASRRQEEGISGSILGGSKSEASLTRPSRSPQTKDSCQRSLVSPRNGSASASVLFSVIWEVWPRNKHSRELIQRKQLGPPELGGLQGAFFGP